MGERLAQVHAMRRLMTDHVHRAMIVTVIPMMMM
jgi:hypothetical protein